MESKNLLEINGLVVKFHTDDAVVHAINGLDLRLEPGQTLGLVGETGAGKTTTALSILRLIDSHSGKIEAGEIIFEGKNLIEATEKDYRKIRGKDISMIFQDPMTALNPVMTVVDQIAEVIAHHRRVKLKEAIHKAVEMLELVRIPAERAHEYPYQFSGGMKQRVVIAMALACGPKLLIADEPTTALDVTIQAQVLEMMKDLRIKYNTSMIMITHDFGIVAETCDKVAVMYAGEIVESGSLEDAFQNPRHPYTIGLFGAIPKLYEDVEYLYQIEGLMPNPTDLPSGCTFSPRCKYAEQICHEQQPEKTQLFGTEHYVKCHIYSDKLRTKSISRSEKNE